MLRSAAGYLNQQIALLVDELDGTEGVSFSFVDTARVYESDAGRHGLCTGKPWINGITIVPRHQRSFHPTQDGHDAFGKAVATKIRDLDWSELRAPADPAAPSTDLLSTARSGTLENEFARISYEIVDAALRNELEVPRSDGRVGCG